MWCVCKRKRNNYETYVNPVICLPSGIVSNIDKARNLHRRCCTKHNAGRVISYHISYGLANNISGGCSVQRQHILPKQCCVGSTGSLGQAALGWRVCGTCGPSLWPAVEIQLAQPGSVAVRTRVTLPLSLTLACA